MIIHTILDQRDIQLIKVDKLKFTGYCSCEIFKKISMAGFDYASNFIQNASNLELVHLLRSHSAGAQSVTVTATGYGFNPHSKKLNIYLQFTFSFLRFGISKSAALSSATQHAMPPEFDRM